MKANKNLLGNLGPQIDLLNTLGGGISMTTLNMYETEHSLVISVQTPSIPGDNYLIEVKQRNLYIYSMLKINSFNKSEQLSNELSVPAFVKVFPLPITVDENKIEANYENGELKIILPFRPKSDNEPKKIKINYK